MAASLCSKLCVPEKGNDAIKDLGAQGAKDLGLPPAAGAYVKGIPILLTEHFIIMQQIREVKAALENLPDQKS
jgi:hypothetical protein